VVQESRKLGREQGQKKADYLLRVLTKGTSNTKVVKRVGKEGGVILLRKGEVKERHDEGRTHKLEGGGMIKKSGYAQRGRGPESNEQKVKRKGCCAHGGMEGTPIGEKTPNPQGALSMGVEKSGD